MTSHASSSRTIRIALDAMGGDYAPKETVAGALAAAAAWPDLSIQLVGIESAVRAELSAQGSAAPAAIRIVHASEVVGMGESPAEAVRKKKDSSINVAVNLVAQKKADAVVSAGSTGAQVVASALFLRFLAGVRRPGIAVTIPNRNGSCLLMDAGANLYCKPEHLLQYGLMASAFCELVRATTRPSVGLLNVGEEEEKGTTLVSEAAEMLKKAPIHYGGYAEGRDLFSGKFDVIVCDGFVGNTLLKACEGMAEGFMAELKGILTTEILGPKAPSVAADIFRRLKERNDYAEYGGAPLLGVNGVSIIAHGRSNARAIMNAIGVARQWAAARVNERIVEQLSTLAENPPA